MPKDEQQFTIQHIEYSHTVVPASMRSAYWKYFGFPSDNANNILTRQKIICTLCNTAIAYNKNTSNLRTHLIARHPELLHELHQSIGVAPTETPSIVPSNTARKRKLQRDEISIDMNLDASNMETANKFKQSKLGRYDKDEVSPDILVITDGRDEFTNASLGEIKPHIENEVKKYERNQQLQPQREFDTIGTETQLSDEAVERCVSIRLRQSLSATDELEYNDFVDTSDVDDLGNTSAVSEETASDHHTLHSAQPYIYADILHPLDKKKLAQSRPPEAKVDFIVEMLISDLLPLHTCTGTGFRQLFSQHVSGSVDIKAISANLCYLHGRMEESIDRQLELISQTNAYGLGIEMQRNFENDQVFCIYFYYFDAENKTFLDVLYKNVSGERFNLSECVESLNLQNCSAFVVAGEKPLETIVDFASTHDIPIIQCLETVLSDCLKRIFHVPDIAQLYDGIQSITESEPFENTNLPDVFENCAWSKLNFLQSVLEHDILINYIDSNKPNLLEDLRQFVDYVGPLKIILETIADEAVPLCTLIRPLVMKLFDEHFGVIVARASHMEAIKDIIETELTNSILSNRYLQEATFFDVRFQHEFIDKEENNRVHLQQAICKRYNRLIELTNIGTQSAIKLEQKESSGQRKSGLKSFFTRINSGSVANATVGLPMPPQKRYIDLEFDRYRCEPPVDLEQCPFSWWQEHIAHYKQLQRIAINYLCVPCCVNRIFHFEANERNVWRNKRFMLRQTRRPQRQFQSQSQSQNEEQQKQEELQLQFQQHKNITLAAESCLWYLHYNKSFYDKQHEGIK